MFVVGGPGRREDRRMLDVDQLIELEVLAREELARLRLRGPVRLFSLSNHESD